MQTIIYLHSLGYDVWRDERARGIQGADESIVIVNATEFVRKAGAEKLADNLARRWAWNVGKEMGIDADGPYVAVAFREASA